VKSAPEPPDPDRIELARRCRRDGPVILDDGRVAVWRKPWTLVIGPPPPPFRPKTEGRKP
jgi:hypothetical protein